MRGIRPNWLLGYLIPTIYILGGDFPQIPIVLITHGSEFEIKEIMEFGQTTKEFAVKVEDLWQSLMQEYLTFSEQSILLRADNSGHYIHLTDFEVIMQALLSI